MADMFGSPIGTSQYLADRVKSINAVTNAELMPSQKRLYEAKAAESEFEVQQARSAGEALALAAAGAGADGEKAPSMASLLRKAAEGAAKRGLTVQAQKLAESAALVDSREASAMNSQANARLHQIQAIRQNAEAQGQFFGTATDEESWQLAGQMFTFQTGLPNPYENIPFSPEIVNRIKQSAVDVEKQLDLEIRRMGQLETKDFRDRRLRQHEETLRIRRAEQAIREARERRLAREGGSGSGVARPNRDQIRQVKELFLEDGIEYDKVDNSQQVAYDISSRAEELRKQNRGLGSGEALHQAYDEYKASGALTVTEIDSGSLLKRNKKQFRGKSKPITEQLPDAAKARLKAGVETTFSNGQVWTLKDGQPSRVR